MDPGTSLACFRWLVAAGWSLLLCDCWLVTCSGTLFEPQEGLWRALGGLLDGSGRAQAGARMAHEAHGRCRAAYGQFGLTFSNVCWRICPFGLTFSNVFGPSDVLAARLCCQIVQGQVRGHPPLVVFWGVSGPGREPLRRVQGPLLLIQYTC